MTVSFYVEKTNGVVEEKWRIGSDHGVTDLNGW